MKACCSALVAVLCLMVSPAVRVYGSSAATAVSDVPVPASVAVQPPTMVAPAWPADATGGIDPAVFGTALRAVACAVRSGDIRTPPSTLTVIDYSKPSTAQRLWVFDLQSRQLLYREFVAHGQGSGDNVPTRFSNVAESHESSLGLYVTEHTYVGKNGYSLRLRGLDKGFNDLAYERAIVMHGAPYVSEAFARQQGRLGRSWGCPALRAAIAHELIDRVKEGGAVFAYGPDGDWLRTSKYLNGGCGGTAAPTLNTF